MFTEEWILRNSDREKLRVLKISETIKERIKDGNWKFPSNNPNFVVWNKGKKLSPLTPELRECISQALKGIPKSEEHKRKIKEHHKKPHLGKQAWNKNKSAYWILKERNPNWKGGCSDFRGSSWRRIRKECYVRDNFICQNCGSTVSLEAHHIIPYRISKDSSLDNLITLCDRCHKEFERQRL